MAIDAEMANDQLLYLTSAQISGIERERAFRVQPKLNDEQRANYRQIIGENTVFSFFRKDGVLSVSRYMPPAEERRFQFWYVHDVRWPDAPHCHSDVKKVTCGDCIVPLDDEWFMAWMWHPIDESEYDESCSYLSEQEAEFE